MRKSLIFPLLVMVFALTAHAQTPTNQDVIDQLTATLQQTIALLIQQVQVLQSQLAELIAQQQTQAAQIQQIQTQTTPVFGSTSTPTESGIISIIPQRKAMITVENQGQVIKPDVDNVNPFGIYFLKVRVLDEKGNTTPVESGKSPAQPISMTIGDKTDDEKIDTISGMGSVDFYHTFPVIPTDKGDIVITFTSGNLSTTYTLSVQ